MSGGFIVCRAPTEWWVVWSFEHGQWWAPHRWGYTPDLEKAGRYTKGDALDIERHANRYSDVVMERALTLTEAEASGPPKE